jgi:hypothetical protein
MATVSFIDFNAAIIRSEFEGLVNMAATKRLIWAFSEAVWDKPILSPRPDEPDFYDLLNVLGKLMVPHLDRTRGPGETMVLSVRELGALFCVPDVIAAMKDHLESKGLVKFDRETGAVAVCSPEGLSELSTLASAFENGVEANFSGFQDLFLDLFDDLIGAETCRYLEGLRAGSAVPAPAMV